MREDDYLIAYGSLLSAYSRQTYSKIKVQPQPISVRNWSRSWCAAYPDEKATYVGAVRNPAGRLNGALFPVEINDELRQREREYDFVEVPAADIEFSLGSDAFDKTSRFWISAIKAPQEPTQLCPLPQSYVDTCLTGCIEISGFEYAKSFVEGIQDWQVIWQNDRSFKTPTYRRNAPIDRQREIEIDHILEACGVLKYRRES